MATAAQTDQTMSAALREQRQRPKEEGQRQGRHLRLDHRHHVCGQRQRQ